MILTVRPNVPVGGGVSVDADLGVLGTVRLTVTALPGEGTAHDALTRFAAATGARIGAPA